MRAHNLVGGCVWFVLSILIVWGSLELGLGSFRRPDSGLFSLITGIILGCLAVLLIVESLARKEDLASVRVVVWSGATQWRNLLIAILALVAYGAALKTVGFVITSFLFMLFLFRTIEPQRWPVSVLCAAASSLCAWVVFELWLRCQLPEGILVGSLIGLL